MREKLRILQVIPTIGKAGAERLVLDICNELNKREHVHVKLLNLRPDNDYPFLSFGVDRSIIHARYQPSLTGKPRSELNDYTRFVTDYNPHVIHSHLYETELITRQVIRKNTRYVTHLHDNMRIFRNFSFQNLFNKAALTDCYEKRIMIRQYRKCNNRFIAISKNTADYFKQCLPADLQDITVLHNCIDYHRFYNPNPRSVKENSFRLVNIGRLVDEKNQGFLIDVMKLLHEKNISVHLDLIGIGVNHHLLQNKINDSGLQDKISLLGKVDDVEGALRQAHLYVHSAVYEPFGLVLLEAMAAGLPCVMLDGKGNRDIAEDGKNGFLIEKPDPILFAQKIELLLTQPDIYSKMSAYAAVFAKQFDVRQYVDRLLEFYQA